MEDRKSKLRAGHIERKYEYRGLHYSVVFPSEESLTSTQCFCAYFTLNTETVKLNISLGDSTKGFWGSSAAFLGSDVISEIEEEAHWGFTFAQIEKVTRKEQDIITKEFVKLGVDYAHSDDEYMGHTLESVCRDCEKVIDKIHEIGAYIGS